MSLLHRLRVISFDCAGKLEEASDDEDESPSSFGAREVQPEKEKSAAVGAWTRHIRFDFLGTGHWIGCMAWITFLRNTGVGSTVVGTPAFPKNYESGFGPTSWPGLVGTDPALPNFA
jgi:hypothetical protein